LLRQVYDKLDAAGLSGLSVREVTRQLGLQRLDGRILLRNLCRKGVAVYTMHDHGKQCFQKYAIYAWLFLSVAVVKCYFHPPLHVIITMTTVIGLSVMDINFLISRVAPDFGSSSGKSKIRPFAQVRLWPNFWPALAGFGRRHSSFSAFS